MKHPWQALFIGWLIAGWTMASCVHSGHHNFTPEATAPSPDATVAAAPATPAPQAQTIIQQSPKPPNVPLNSESNLSTNDEKNDFARDSSGTNGSNAEKSNSKSSGFSDDEGSGQIVDSDHPLVSGLEIQQKYFPLLRNQGDNRKFRTISGVVSYVDDEQRTKSGKRFYPDDMVAAHKYWPMGTVVKCINLTNDKSVVVQIIDRGPYIDGRVLDLSEAAGRKIGLLHKGISKCRVEVLAYPKKSK